MTQEAKFTMHRVQMVSYQTPSIIEKESQKLVCFGKTNQFPFDLIDLYNDSPTHNAIVNGKIGYICGRGLIYNNPSREKKFRVDMWLKDANSSETWNQLSKKMTTDYEIHNGYVLEGRVNQDGSIDYFHLDWSWTRRSTNPSIILFSSEWEKDGKQNRNVKPIEIPLFDGSGTQDHFAIYHADYRPNMEWYPLPIYQGALAAIETDVEINNYWVNEIKNGFSSGTIVAFNNGVPEDEDKMKDINKQFKAKTTGSSNAGGPLLVFAADKDHAPEILSLSGNDLNKRYNAMAKDVQQNIFIGHQVVSPMLFGVKTEGQLGGRDEIKTAYEIFKTTYVDGRQRTVETTINKVMALDIGISGVKLLGYEPVDLGLILTDEVIITNLTQIEIRKLIAKQTGLDLTEQKEMSYQEMNKEADDLEEKMISMFEGTGDDMDLYKILAEFDIDFDLDGNPIDVRFADDLTTIEQEILALINNNPEMSLADMSTALDLDILEVRTAVKSLQKDKLVGKSDGFNWKLLVAGIAVLETLDLPESKTELKIKYKYTLREDAPALLPGSKSRNFCRALMSMNKLWSRQQIDLMRNDMEPSSIAPQVTDVWLARGGWYRPPSTSVSVPFCRHIWKQVVVIEK